MKKKILAIVGSVFVASLMIYATAEAQFGTTRLLIFPQPTSVSTSSNCPSGKICGWVNATNVSSFGVPWSASTQNFYNDGPTKDKICQISGYEINEGGNVNQAKWDNCNDEYYITWDGSKWVGKKCWSVSYVTNVYCSKNVPPANNPPSITWASAPDSAACNAPYTVMARGSDADGNLSTVSVDKDGSPFAYMGGGDGYGENSGRTISDEGPKTVTFTAWATDSAGGRSGTISKNIEIGACPNVTPPVSPTGSLSASCTALTGIASDADTPNQGVWVHLYLDGPAGSGSIFASPTSDSSTHQYSTSYSLTGTHTVYAYGIDTTGTSPNSSIGQATITCGSTIPAPTGFITASPSTLPFSGGTATVSWGVANADTCTASGSWSGSKSPSGSQTVSVANSSTFTLSCANAGGSWSQSASVAVDSNPGNPGNPVNPVNSASLSVSTTCAAPGSNITFKSVAGGSVSSHSIEKDSNQDGLFGTIANFGSAGGAQTYSAAFSEGKYDFRTVVNGSTYSGTVRVTVSPSCGGDSNSGGGNSGGSSGGTVTPPPPKCTDPSASNMGGLLPCLYPSFTLSASPSIVKAKSLGGYSGITEKEVMLSVNPVYGFNSPVQISVDPSSLPAEVKPEYSFGGGTWTANPTATMNWDGSFYRQGGIIYVPVLVRFGGELKKGTPYSVTFKGLALPGGNGTGKTASVKVDIDSQPLYPGYHEI